MRDVSQKNMKNLIRASALLVILPALAFAELPRTEADFILQFREALSSRDATKIDALTYRQGMSQQDMAMSARSNQRLVQFRGEIEDIAIKPLPKTFEATTVANGRKIEMTGAPIGLIVAEFTIEGPMGASASSTPFTVIDGVYYIVGPKISDLGWKGPPDKNIGFMVVGQGADNAQIVVAWNASGVDLSRTFSETSSTFWGQYIDSVTVTSDSENAAFKLMIMEDGNTIYTSESINGKGTLEYKRKS
jgi:hypothetical protein